MVRRVECQRCGSLCEYDDKSTWDGNRDFEDIVCPKCGEVLNRVFTDLCPSARIINEEK